MAGCHCCCSISRLGLAVNSAWMWQVLARTDQRCPRQRDLPRLQLAAAQAHLQVRWWRLMEASMRTDHPQKDPGHQRSPALPKQQPPTAPPWLPVLVSLKMCARWMFLLYPQFNTWNVCLLHLLPSSMGGTSVNSSTATIAS